MWKHITKYRSSYNMIRKSSKNRNSNTKERSSRIAILCFVHLSNIKHIYPCVLSKYQFMKIFLYNKSFNMNPYIMNVLLLYSIMRSTGLCQCRQGPRIVYELHSMNKDMLEKSLSIQWAIMALHTTAAHS